MKTTHITKVCAVVMAMLMLLSMVPASVLPVFAVSSEGALSIFDTVTLGKGTVTNTENYKGADYATAPSKQDSQGNTIVNDGFSPYEPYWTNDDEHPFLMNGSAWIDLSKIYYGVPATPNVPITKWSANTSVVNITGTGKTYGSGNGILTGTEIYAIADHNLINEYLWANDTATVGGELQNGVINSYDIAKAAGSYVESKNGTTAYAYNRYDAMQGKWGLTLDKNVSYITWSPTYVKNAYGTGKHMDNSVLYLSDTPYLFYSTEAVDDTQMAISLLIGTPVQAEQQLVDSKGNILTSVKWKDKNANVTTNADEAAYEFRWYTITDNAARPGVGNDTLDNSMVPLVTVSDVVLDWYALTNSSDDILDAIADKNADNVDPIKVAQNAKIDTETMYVSGAITGCIDFTQLLPLVKGAGKGREDIKYKVAQIRVDTKTKTRAAGDSAARINYMYFGPGQAAIFTPQSTVGSDVNGANWMYAKNDPGIGDQNPNGVAVDYTDHYIGYSTNWGYESGYTNGWHNGQTVSITNTPNNPQLMTIDTYGKGGGKLITYDQYKTETGKNFPKLSTDSNSKIWKFTDANNVTQYLEAEYSQSDKEYYIMVTVPVRKWVNVLGDSRKLSMTVRMLQYGVKSDSKTKLEINPSFCVWGSDHGSVGNHQKTTLGVRYAGEEMLGVFGVGYYNVDSAASNGAALVDKTISESVDYNVKGTSNESWFDWQRSPYVFDYTVKNANSTYSVSEYMAGYTFVASMRFVMPIGSKMSVQSMKGDGNSAGLNTYSTSGQIVSAYDGGTGVQPVVNVSNTVPEYKATYSNKKFTLTKNGTISGTITSGAAAYGPMLEESRYTIYDLLDTEMLRATGKDANHKDNYGKAKQPVYGEMWWANENMVIHAAPNSSATYGRINKNNEFCVYATIILTDKNREKWGLVGVLTSEGSTELGWVKIWDSSHGAYCSRRSGVPFYEDVEMKSTSYNADATTGYSAKAIVMALKNEWAISNFCSIENDSTKFRDSAGGNHTYSTIAAKKNGSHGETYNEGHSIIGTSIHSQYNNAYNSSLQLKFANMSTGDGNEYHYSSGKSLPDFYLRSINGTDMEWGFKRKTNTSGNMSMGMSRIFQTPILLKELDDNGKSKLDQPKGSYPVLYLDYTSTIGFTVGLSIRIDGKERLWYVDDTEIVHEEKGLNTGNHYAYLSFEKIMTKDYPNAKKIEVVGLSLYTWNASSVTEGNIVIRRCEIWQEMTAWYDEIIADNQGAGTSTKMNETVKDSINIINDSFFNTHSESADGEWGVEIEGSYSSNIGINNNVEGQYGKNQKFTYTDGTNSNSYKKQNSNKGWKAYLRNDTDHDGQIESNGDDKTYYSHDAKTVDGIYQYESSVGNLRVWMPAGNDTSVVFEADRSFNTKNYKYLYYSYSMRDVESGIAAEEAETKRTDGKNPGIAVAIKSTQHGSIKSYSEVEVEGVRTWAYYDAGNSYWVDAAQDNRVFRTTINAAVDLSTLQEIESINQLVFYLHNPLDKQAEFYINYIYLSNNAPNEFTTANLEQVQTQYYYMMDNTGDRYSARFPTIDNPTGQVSGTNADNDRTNPIKITRGQLLSTGTYFNGDRIYGYGGDKNTNRTFDESSASVGYYEKTYGHNSDPNAEENGSMKNILFYAGTSDDLHDINDYYTYKDSDRVYTYVDKDGKPVTVTVPKDNKGEIYDMMWSYGRWYTSDGATGMNTLYIGDPATPAEQRMEGVFRENGISGGLTRRYATENYVLLRSGITPKKYETYFDADGGEFIYEGSSEDTANLHKVNENSYFLTQNVILSHYIQPGTKDFMAKEEPQKPGYTFKYWQKIQLGATDTVDKSLTDAIKKEFPGTAIADGELTKYTRKDKAQVDYFKAVWEKDPNAKNTTATFKDNKGNKWFERKTNIESTNGTYAFQIPTVTNLVDGGVTKQIYGWKAYDKNGKELYADKVFNPGDRLYLLEDVEFSPVLDANLASTFTITLTGAKLAVHSVNGNIHPIEDHGVTVTSKTSGGVTTRTYKKVPANYHLRAIPDTVVSNGKWTDGTTTGGDKYQFVSSVVVSSNKNYFDFGAYEDRSLSYTKMSTLDSFYTAQNSVLATNTSQQIKDSNEVSYYGKFEAPAGATVKAYGTLFTVQKYFDLYDTSDDAAMADLNKHLRLDDTTVNATTVKNKNYTVLKPTAENESKIKTIKFVQADACTDDGEFLFTITGTNTLQTYYARTYVIYTDSKGAYKVAYGDVVSVGVTDPAA